MICGWSNRIVVVLLGLVHEAVDPGLHGLNTLVVDEELLSVADVDDSRDIGGDLDSGRGQGESEDAHPPDSHSH